MNVYVFLSYQLFLEYLFFRFFFKHRFFFTYTWVVLYFILIEMLRDIRDVKRYMCIHILNPKVRMHENLMCIDIKYSCDQYLSELCIFNSRKKINVVLY